MTSDNMISIMCDKGPEMLALAVRCRFITPGQKEEILPQIRTQAQKDPKALLAPYLLKNRFLSKENIQLLFSIKNHLQILLADQQFGQLGIVNQFVSPDKVKQALDIQVKIFQKNKTSIKIGDILLQSQDISPADNTALLLTQDRIPEELLSEAMNTIARTEIEKMEMEQRFGAIAVKKGVITAGQLSRALKVQTQEVEEKKPKRYLGDILKEMFKVSEADITAVLKVQRKIETKRMKLEEKLTRYNLEKEAQRQALAPYFSYRVSKDQLTAYVCKREIPEKEINLQDFLDWFALSGITYGLAEEKDIQTFLDKEDLEQEFKIAEGSPATPYQKEKVDFKVDVRFSDKKKPGRKKGSDHSKVEPDDLIAVITPHREALPGTDVFGRPVHLPAPKETLLSCGEGVTRKGDQLFATIKGTPRLSEDGTLTVQVPEKISKPPEPQQPEAKTEKPQLKEPQPEKRKPQEAAPAEEKPPESLTPESKESAQPEKKPERPALAEKAEGIIEIEGDITSDTLDKYTSCSLRVKGNISAGVMVSCHDLILEGSLLGNLFISGDLEVKGDIGSLPEADKEKTGPVQVTVKGGIQVSGNIMHSKIFTGSGLIAPKGDLIATQISSCRDIVVNNILSPSKNPSKVRMTSENLLEKAEMEKLDAEIQNVSKELEALLPDDDLGDLAWDLMRKETAMKKYQEKQKITSFFEKALTDPDLDEISDVALKVSAYKEKSSSEEDARIPDGEQASQFLNFLIKTLSDLESENQLSILQEFARSASGMLETAKKTSEKLTKKMEALSQELGKEIKADDPKIQEANQKIDELKGQKKALLANRKKAASLPDAVIKVKNQVEASTIIVGEKAKLVVDTAIYGVAFSQEPEAPGKKARILVKGYFE